MCDGSVALSAPFLEDQRSISKFNVPVDVGRPRQPSCVPCWECRHRQWCTSSVGLGLCGPRWEWQLTAAQAATLEEGPATGQEDSMRESLDDG